MKTSATFRVVLTAMLASMVCVATMCVQIQSPMGGYVNLGDALVLLSAYLLGKKYGPIAAGLGSMLADVLLGYGHYAPGTLVIKALCAFVAAVIYARMNAGRTVKCVVSGIAAEIIMVVGYLFYAWIVLGYGAAAISSVPGNLAQAAVGIIVSTALLGLLLRSEEIREFMKRFSGR